MGNQFCCMQSKRRTKIIILPSIRTTHSLQQFIDPDQQKIISLQQQFRGVYLEQLQYLEQIRSFQSIEIININIQILTLLQKSQEYRIYFGKTDFQTGHQQMLLKVYKKQNINLHLVPTARRKSIAIQNLILLHNDSKFIANTIQSREDQNYIYYFLPVLQGDTLFTYADQTTMKGIQFSQNLDQNVRFLVAGIILGLDYLHNKLGLILNDLKLEHVWIDEEGYPQLVGLAGVQPEKDKYLYGYERGKNSYLSPQKVNHQDYTHAVDLWSLGVLTYTLSYGQFPFEEGLFQDRDIFNTEVAQREGKLKKMSIKGSDHLKNFINALIRINPKNRLGVENIEQLKHHQFFEGLDWLEYQQRMLESPLKKIIQKYPLRKGTDFTQQVNLQRFKVFRTNSGLDDKYLFNLSKEKQKLRKSGKSGFCTTRNRLTRPFTIYSLGNSEQCSLGAFESDTQQLQQRQLLQVKTSLHIKNEESNN